MPDPLRVFLDANILFSASLKDDSRFLQFWRMRDVVPITSMYAADETRRNCAREGHAARFERLVEKTHIVSDVPGAGVPHGMVLRTKDVPILTAAIHAGADYLITGDRHDFGKWIDHPIETHLGRLVIQVPSRFLIDHRDRLL